MSSPLLPLPNTPDKARLLLNFIRYGITMTGVREVGKQVHFYLKSPERIHMKKEDGTEYDPTELVKDFGRQLREIEPDVDIIIKRAPYKNDFDDWDDCDSQNAYEEYKRWLMCVYNEEQLMF